MSEDLLQEAETLIAKCFGEYKEEIPQREIMNGFAMLPQLVAEVKRLRDENDYLRNADCLGCIAKLEQLAAKDIELARWQKVARDERAKLILDSEDKFERAKIHHCPHITESCQDDCDFSWCPSSDFWRSIAAQELQLETTQEAGYLERLEKIFEMENGAKD
jgi:hypothetical protein